MSDDLKLSLPTSTPSRYPKRKRPVVTYAEPQDDEGLGLEPDSDADNDEQLGSRKKTRKALPKKKPTPRQKVFPFMSLPPELRNKIYELALIDPNGIHIRTVKGWFRPRVRHCAPQMCLPVPGHARLANQQWLRPDGNVSAPTASGVPVDYKPALVPALLATSKAISAEVASMFWGQPFYFADSTALHTFLISLRPSSKALLRDITLLSWGASRSHKFMNCPAFGQLRGALNLERFSILDYVYNHSYRTSRGPEGDPERARQAARKLWMDCHPWLEAMIESRGIEALKKVFKIDKINYKPWPTSIPVAPLSPWTEQRSTASERVMFEEFERMNEVHL